MKLYVDLETLQLIEAPGFRNPVQTLRFKRGDSAQLDVAFLSGGATVTAIGDPGTLEIQFGIKPRNRYDIGYLVHSADWTMPAPDAESPVYRCSPSFNTLELDSALGVGSATGTELSEITLMGEITWREGVGEPTSTRTFLVIVENDVNRGTEGVPSTADPAYPAPSSLLLKSELNQHAVRYDAAQTPLTKNQRDQFEANYGVPISSYLPTMLLMVGGNNMEVWESHYGASIDTGAYAVSSVLRIIGGPILQTIGAYSFEGCFQLSELTLPNCKTIGTMAFYNCAAINSFSAPELVTIGDVAFANAALPDLLLPELVTLGGAAFEYAQLGNVTLPKLTNLGNGAFNFASTGDISLPIYAGNASNSFFGGSYGHISLPMLSSIGSSAFESATFASLSVPLASSIASLAFAGCNPGAALKFPSVTQIHSQAFYYAGAITDLWLNCPLSGVNATAFEDSSVTTIHLRPAPNTPAGWAIGADQTIGGKSGITVVADWTTFPN